MYLKLTLTTTAKSYTALTGTFQLPGGHEKPHVGNVDGYPRGMDMVFAQTGWSCMRQLSELNSKENSVLVQRENWLVDSTNPGFLRLRLLEQPTATVRVLCASDTPSLLTLSDKEFIFTPENYNIEQSIRCSAAGEGINTFCKVLIRAESDDKDIDGLFI